MEQTFIMIKPDGVQRGLVGEIISRFEKRGFFMKGLKLITVDRSFAEKHYADLSAKPFFSGLVDYIISGPVVATVWEGKNVVKTGRKIIGATNPSDSDPGTIKEKGKVISASEKPKNRMKMEIEEVSSYGALPLLSLNHVSLLCRSVWDSVRFYEDVLGFVLIKRPSSFNFNGAWLYNYGIGIHLIENPSIDEYDTISELRPINPKDNHISFQCTDVGLVIKRLQDMGMRYVTAIVEEEGAKVEQVFFHDPDGYMVELCNCENIPVIPISSCSFKPRGQSFKKAPTSCGFMENVMMESLSMDMMNFSF